MRVDAYNKISQVYQTSMTKSTTKTAGSSATDHVEISRIGKDYQVAKQAVAAAPDVRIDKINAIKERMESGTYNISAEEVADKIVDSYFNTII
jgi:negative regulator of flagellin synthesis FlgM